MLTFSTFFIHAVTAFFAGQDLDQLTQKFDVVETAVEMRDGVKLHTVVCTPRKPVIPKTAAQLAADAAREAGQEVVEKDAEKKPPAPAPEKLPIILLRTPYGANANSRRALLGDYFRDLVADGYIFAFQDIRGRHKSGGTFAMMRAPRSTTDPKTFDEASDAHDTMEWLIKNTAENNGRIGMLGISYDGWLTVQALREPHPAFKAASPQSPPSDMFMGDDFHHNGAFRLSYGYEYVAMMETNNVQFRFKFDRYDTYEWYLALGSLANANPKYLNYKLPTWNDFIAHPNYDEFWQKQAAVPQVKSANVPTLHVTGWWDQEDFYGPQAIYAGMERYDAKNHNSLVVGPWNHGGWATGTGSNLGKIDFGSATARHYRQKIQAPFFAYHLKGKGEQPKAEATLFQTGSNQWVTFDKWPPKNHVDVRNLHMHPNEKLTFGEPPSEAKPTFDEYLSDPAKPVPYRPRPIPQTYGPPGWSAWLVDDQRFVHRRPDVASWQTEPLAEDLTIAGNVTAKLFASTTGSDADWVVKLIDVFPERTLGDQTMGGYQLMVSNEVYRARFRKSFERPVAVEPDAIVEYTIDLHGACHRFRKGHRIMVHVQSSWFPLIDRNPQKFVPNIFEAKDEDFQKATQRIHRAPGKSSHLVLPVLTTP